MGRKFYNQEPSKKASFEMIWCMCGHFRLSAQKEQFFFISFTVVSFIIFHPTLQIAICCRANPRSDDQPKAKIKIVQVP